MSQAAINATVLQGTESQQMEGLVKILMNARKNPHVGVTINTATILVEVTSVPMLAARKDIRRKALIATDAKEPPEDAGQQILSASENLFLYLSTSCLSSQISKLVGTG